MARMLTQPSAPTLTPPSQPPVPVEPVLAKPESPVAAPPPAGRSMALALTRAAPVEPPRPATAPISGAAPSPVIVPPAPGTAEPVRPISDAPAADGVAAEPEQTRSEPQTVTPAVSVTDPAPQLGSADSPRPQAPASSTSTAEPLAANGAASGEADKAPVQSSAQTMDASVADPLEALAQAQVQGEDQADVAPLEPAPSFVTEARRRAFWSSRPMRRLLWLAALLLLIALALQMVLSRRDWLAAREPGLTPVLASLFQPLGCTVGPYRRLDAILIDSSAFNRVSSNSFRFSVTLRNMADLPVASPALELTLTDAQDQALVRRVVSPAELGAPPALAARGEFAGVNVLTVAELANPEAVVGYRLTVFYP